jgi:hypothetical protein
MGANGSSGNVSELPEAKHGSSEPGKEVVVAVGELQNTFGGSVTKYFPVSRRGGNASMDDPATSDDLTGPGDVVVTSTVGGYDDLQKYGDSVYSRAKESLIRAIAYDVFKALGVRDAESAKRAPIDQVVKHLASVVPNHKRGKHFTDGVNKSSSKQREICRVLANSINKNYAGQLVPLNLSEDEMCVKIAEVMNSLFTGLHTEFMTVAGDILRIVRNLETLKQVIDASYKRQLEITNASGDPELRAQAQTVQDFYNRVKAELERQLAILTNLVNVAVGPTGKSLIGLLEENRDFAGFVRDLKADLGTSAFGDKLSYLLSGVSNVAHSAELVDRALKVIGMSVAEFRSAKSPQDLRLKILSTIERKSPTSKELDKMMAASEIIYNNLSVNFKKISELLGKKGGDDCGCSGGEDDGLAPYATPSGFDPSTIGGKVPKKSSESQLDEFESNPEPEIKEVEDRLDDNNEDNKPVGENSSTINIVDMSRDLDGSLGGVDSDDEVVLGGNIVGGNDDEDTGLVSYWARKSLSTKIAKKKKYRELLLKDFRKLLKLHYRNIVEASNHVARRIGTEIPVSDDLHRFVDVFHAIPNLDSEKLHIALSGYPKDSVSRQEREIFMNKFQLLLVALEPLMKGQGGENFKRIYDAIKGLVKAIDDFSDKMVRALTEIHVDRPEDIRAALKQTANSFFGSAEGGGGEELFGSGSFVELDKIKMELRYYLSIYNIKTNLGRVSEEMKEFGEDYEQVLGEESGWLINRIKRDYLALIDDADPYPDNNRPAIPEVVSLNVPASAIGAVGRAGNDILAKARVYAGRLPPVTAPAVITATEQKYAKGLYEQLKTLYTRQMNAKVRMVEVAQAIDLYLRSFADGIARNPDSIKSVIKMLDQVDIVAKWFTERSGDQLASLFEAFPADTQNNYSTTVDAVVDPTEEKITLPMQDNHYYKWLDTAYGGLNYKMPGNPVIGRTLIGEERKTNAMKNLLTLSEKTVKSMRALENILSAFSTIGSKFGDIDPQAKTFMNPGQIFNALCEYITVGAFTTGYQAGNITAGVGMSPHDDIQVTIDGTTSDFPRNAMPNYRQNRGDGRIHITSGLTNLDDRHTSVAMSSIPTDMKTMPTAIDDFWNYHNTADNSTRKQDVANWTDRFYDTDLLFLMTIKSIVCKVFTVVDCYRLFNRPLSKDNSDQYDSLTPLRTILGGSNIVKVIPEAVELYLRLPLLLEWYRDKFSFAKSTNPDPDAWRLALTPNIDGIWGKIISMVFDRLDYVENGNYSENQLQKLINDINDVYRHYKSKYPKATVRNILNSFVVEINRAFGFIRQKDITAYLNDRRQYLNPSDYPENKDDFNQYDILNSEDQFLRSPAPSDKFITVAERQKQRKERVMIHLQKDILQLRRNMDADFRKYTNENRRTGGKTIVSFVDSLRNYKRDLENAKSDKEQYDVVVRMLQGTNKLSNVSVDKLVMLHEAVAAPLAVLFNIYKVLAKYNALLHGAAYDNISKWAAEFENPASAYTGELTALGGRGDLRFYDDCIDYFQRTYKEDTQIRGVNSHLFASALVGNQIYYITPAATNYGYLNRPAAGNIRPRNPLMQNINLPSIAKDLILALMDLCGNPNGLMSCTVSNDGVINVDWSKLEDLSVNLLQQVKNNLNNIRIEFTSSSTNEILNKYTNKDLPGSVAWLEEHLVEQLFKDRDKAGLSVGHTKLTQTLKAIGAPVAGRESLDSVISELVYYQRNGTNLLNNSVSNNLTTFPFNVLPLSVESDMLSNPQKTQLNTLRNIHASRVAAAAVPVEPGLNDVLQVPTILFESKDTLNYWNLHDERAKSLMLSFNKMVHRYLNDNLDDNNLKIYPALFESFMNSAASHEVVQNKSFPNVGVKALISHNDHVREKPLNAAAGALPLASPPEGTILFASTALTMKALMMNMDKLLKKRRNVYESLAEVPEYMKERMKCNLPLYSKMFQLIFNRAELLRKLLNCDLLKNNLAGNGIACTRQILHVKTGVSLDPLVDVSGYTNERNLQYLNGLLSHLCDLSFSIKKCCDSVYKELQDVAPYFMDLSKDFINDYKSRYGVLPFMPASMVLLPQLSFNGEFNPAAVNLYAWSREVGRNLLLPTKINGSNVYKFNLASRVLLARNDVEPSLDHMPGAKDIYNAYASVAQRNSVISANEYANTVKLMVLLSRYLNDGAAYSRLFDSFTNATGILSAYQSNTVFNSVLSVTNYYVDQVPTTNHNTLTNLLLAMQTRNRLDPGLWGDNINNLSILGPVCAQFNNPNTNTVFGYVEDLNKKQAKESFVSKIQTIESNIHTVTRENLRVHNILDLGIVPINVHAFMKEVPFTNILNYSYTFDRMVHDMIIPDYVRKQPNYALTADTIMLNPLSPVNNTRELFVKLLVYPYTQLSYDHAELRRQYYGLVASLFNGNDDLNMKLARPRYLSDQLWHKVLLSGSVMKPSNSIRYDDVRPVGPVDDRSRSIALSSEMQTLKDQIRREHPEWNEAQVNVDPRVGTLRGRLVFMGAELPNLESGPSGYEAQRIWNNPLSIYPVPNSRSTGMAEFPNVQPGLKYWDKNKKIWTVTHVGAANRSPHDMLYLAELGHTRFNTKLVRNLTWLVNLQRTMRVVMINHLSWIDTPVITGLKVMDPTVTEYNSNDAYQASDFQGTEYSAM